MGCLQPGVKLDFRHLPAGSVATAVDVESELARIGHRMSPLEVVVVDTAAGFRFGLPLTGFTVSCLPVRMERASAGWCRAVAINEPEATSASRHKPSST